MYGALCEALVIVRDLKHHLLGYFVLHIIGKTARFIGAFVPVLINTRRREFIDGNHRLTHSVYAPARILCHFRHALNVSSAYEIGESRQGWGWSLRLDARELHHLAPLLSIVRNKFAELGRRAWKHRGA